MATTNTSSSTQDNTPSYLYLHLNENPSIFLVSPVLNATNYHSWSRSFITTLFAKDKVEFVLGPAIQPVKTDVSFPAWFRCNSMVVSWLLHSVSPSIRESIIWIDLAIDIWTDRKHRFAQGDLARISTLQMEATTLSQGELSITDFFTKLRVIWDELDFPLGPRLYLLDQERSSLETIQLTPQQYQILAALFKQPTSNTSNVHINQVGTISTNTSPGNIVSIFQMQSSNIWLLDSGATDHACISLKFFTSYQKINLIPICLPNGKIIHAHYKGTDIHSQEKIGLIRHHNCLYFFDPSTCNTDTNCTPAKQKKLPYTASTSTSLSSFELMHIDIWSPITASMNGFKYLLTIVDDYSSYTWIIRIVDKSSVKNHILNFLYNIENQFNKKVKTIRIDNGVEFIMHDIFLSKGIIYQTTCVETPEQNGVVEPQHVVFLINQMPTPILQNETPHERVHGSLCDLSMLRVFGCLCYANTIIAHRKKFDDRVVPGIFLGFKKHTKGYLFLNLKNHKVEISRNVAFHENVFPYHNTPKIDNSLSLPLPNHYTTNYDDLLPLDFPHTDVLPPDLALMTELLNYNRISPTCKQTILSISSNVEPTCYSTTSKQPQWVTAMHVELDALQANNTWELTTLYLQTKPPLAVLVAKGYNQIEGLDYLDTFTPVAKLITVRLLLAIVASKFLLALPPPTKLRFVNSNAGRQWYAKLHQFLLSNNYNCSISDNSFFLKHDGNHTTVLLIYVDDILITGNDNGEIQHITDLLHSTFRIKNLGDLTYFLGLEVARNSKGIHLSQRKYVLDILAETGLLDSSPVPTPMVPKHSSTNTDRSLDDDVATSYRRLIGKLIFDHNSQFMSAPTTAHQQATNRILRYLKGTPGAGIHLPRTSTIQLKAFCESDWTTCPDTRRSVTGFTVYLDNSLIPWRSKKQPTVSRSSSEAEYRSLASTHIDIDCHIVREKVVAGLIKLLPISTTTQIADIPTKSLPPPTFQLLRSKLARNPLERKSIFSHSKGEIGLKVFVTDDPSIRASNPLPAVESFADKHHLQTQSPRTGPPKVVQAVPGAQYFVVEETSPTLGGGQVVGGRVIPGSKPATSSSYDLVEPMKYLFVRVVKARDLPSMDITGSLDPYVEVKMGNFVGSTNHFEKNQNPEWNKVFAFAKENQQSSIIEVTVKDKDRISDDIVGKVWFDMPEVPKRIPPDSPLAPQWYRIDNRNGEKKGELMLAVWRGTQADEAFQDAWHSDAVVIPDGRTISNYSQIRSKVYMSPRLWYVRVQVVEAQDLVPSDKSKLPDASVKVQIGNQISKSKPIRGVNPQWNHKALFVAAYPFEESLIFTIEDSVGNKDETIGNLVLPISKIHKRIDDKDVHSDSGWFLLEKSMTSAMEEQGKGKESEKDKDKFFSRIHVIAFLEGGYHVLDESTYYSSDLRPSSKQLHKKPIGVLELGILNVNVLSPPKTRDGRGTSDTYCVAKYGLKWVRTRTIVNNLNPKFHEQYTWEVYDTATVLTLGVFDNAQIHNSSIGNKDSKIGKVRIRISTLETDRVYTHKYPLLSLEKSGLKKYVLRDLNYLAKTPTWSLCSRISWAKKSFNALATINHDQQESSIEKNGQRDLNYLVKTLTWGLCSTMSWTKYSLMKVGERMKRRGWRGMKSELERRVHRGVISESSKKRCPAGKYLMSCNVLVVLVLVHQAPSKIHRFRVQQPPSTMNRLGNCLMKFPEEITFLGTLPYLAMLGMIGLERCRLRDRIEISLPCPVPWPLRLLFLACVLGRKFMSALLDLYGKCGSLDEARGIFDQMKSKDVVSWTTMIHRCFEDGRKEEVFSLFRDLTRSVLNKCADHAAEHLGNEVHGYMMRVGCDPCSFTSCKKGVRKDMINRGTVKNPAHRFSEAKADVFFGVPYLTTHLEQSPKKEEKTKLEHVTDVDQREAQVDRRVERRGSGMRRRSEALRFSPFIFPFSSDSYPIKRVVYRFHRLGFIALFFDSGFCRVARVTGRDFRATSKGLPRKVNSRPTDIDKTTTDVYRSQDGEKSRAVSTIHCLLLRRELFSVAPLEFQTSCWVALLTVLDCFCDLYLGVDYDNYLVCIDRSWMNARCLSEEYEKGVSVFLQYVKEKAKTYTVWTWHGEVLDQPMTSRGTNYVEEWMSDHLVDMICDVGEDNFRRANLYDSVINDSEQPLYPGCTNFTLLSATLKLFSLKARNRWTHKSFTELLELLKDMLPENNTLPIRNYEAKKVLCPMGLEYQKIHACPNDFVLYIKEFASLKYCPTCDLSRFKKNLTKTLVKKWKKIDETFPEFGADPRNLRLALATYGMNPYGNLSSKQSSWPVMLMIYNLSPLSCMKRKYVMLSMMISGPKQPSNDIDVYLKPLIDDLKLLWEEGVKVFDSDVEENFCLRHFAWPICEENTSYLLLKHGQKTVYTRHRKFLPRNHPYRRLKKAFNGSVEDEVVCRPRNGEEVYNEVKNIDIQDKIWLTIGNDGIRLLCQLKNEGIRLLCQLEMWMYPVERYMKILKGYVKNQYRPEASIIERYIAEEVIEFCSAYMPSCELYRRAYMKQNVKVRVVVRQEVDQAHLYILNNTDDVIPYISEHVNEIKASHPRMSEKWELNEHVKTFLPWFKKKIYATPNVSETLLRLSRGPNTDVITYGGYYINNISFQTKEEDDKSRVQNSGVTLKAESVHFSSSKDKNPITASISYFGVIQEIWEVDYVRFRVPVFKCKWVYINFGMITDGSGFTLVDLKKMSFTNEPFIMASQATQIFYVSDPANEKWSVVLEGKNHHGFDDEESLCVLQPPCSTSIPIEDSIDDVVDDIHAIRSDHDEGIWDKTIS
ncbi:hypothetical protein V8G54_021957 [Vigna mungo]|uniref:Uncharacterized protein n=1 Tax=Vigna mungo TaxID=3915 RepID=A0AAQ3RY49_VIGMU